MTKISTSILSATNRMESVERLNSTNTDYIHIDAMDNIFVPNYQLPLDEVNELGKYTHKLFDIHLMLADPEPYIKGLNIKNIDSITIHIEIDKDIHELIELIKFKGYKVGLAIKPHTDISLINSLNSFVPVFLSLKMDNLCVIKGCDKTISFIFSPLVVLDLILYQ